ncbi:hypothetical protein GGR50DRAFT_495714 [Xylaria sp. CBS 124048]|nr:hypothetical protein GGR50DRAFT_495714 [Xylaria sp. CBS 124048]
MYFRYLVSCRVVSFLLASRLFQSTCTKVPTTTYVCIPKTTSNIIYLVGEFVRPVGKREGDLLVFGYEFAQHPNNPKGWVDDTMRTTLQSTSSFANHTTSSRGKRVGDLH